VQRERPPRRGTERPRREPLPRLAHPVRPVVSRCHCADSSACSPAAARTVRARSHRRAGCGGLRRAALPAANRWNAGGRMDRPARERPRKRRSPSRFRASTASEAAPPGQPRAHRRPPYAMRSCSLRRSKCACIIARNVSRPWVRSICSTSCSGSFIASSLVRSSSSFFMFRRDSQNGLSLAIVAARAVDIRPLALPARARSG
jgi:hypothetical protein